MRIHCILAGLVVLLSAGLFPAAAQNQARTFNGSLSTGWSYSRASSFFQEERENAFGTLRLDHQGYILFPQFLTYRLRPRFSRGFENIFSGRSQGTGVDFDTTFLPQQPWPVSFHYSKHRRLGLLSGLGSNYARTLSENDDSTLSVIGQYLVPGRPNFTVEFNRYAAATNPEQVLIQGLETKGRIFSIFGRDLRKGWNLLGRMVLQNRQNLAPPQQRYRHPAGKRYQREEVLPPGSARPFSQHQAHPPVQ